MEELIIFMNDGDCPVLRMIEIYARLSGVKTQYVKSDQKIDEIHGPYPVMLYKHWYIHRDQIAQFWQVYTNINSEIGFQSQRDIEYWQFQLSDTLTKVKNIESSKSKYNLLSEYYQQIFCREFLSINGELQRNELKFSILDSLNKLLLTDQGQHETFGQAL